MVFSICRVLQQSPLLNFRKSSSPLWRYFREINLTVEYLDRKSYSKYTKSDRNLIQMSLDINARELPGNIAYLWKGQGFIWVSATVGL